MPSRSPQLSGLSLSELVRARRDLMRPPASSSLIVNGGLQLGQAFAEAQIGRRSRAIVSDVRSCASDFSFGQRQWRLGAIVLGGCRAKLKPAGVNNDRFGSMQF
jgi:hypothetical protein